MPSPEFLTDAPDFFTSRDVMLALHQYGFEDEATQLGVVRSVASGYDIGLEQEINLTRELLVMREQRNVAPGELGSDYFDLLGSHDEALIEHAQMASEFLLGYPGFVVVRRMTESTLDFQEPRLVVVTDGSERYPHIQASLKLEDTDGDIIELDRYSELLCDVANLPKYMRSAVKSELQIPTELTPLW